MGADFGKIGFSGALRPSQVASSSIIERELESDSKELLIVAPPGSGKTVLGLYVWSDLVRLPTLVLSPNSAIQAQWIARAKELFHLDGREEQIGTDPKNPGILTSLTYQSITLPKRGGEGLDDAALELWISKLMTPNEADGSVEAEDRESALAWIADLEDKNPDYHSGRLGHYRKKVRDDFADHGNALWVLHESAKANLMRLSEVGIGLIILDECHHLMEHWGKVLIEAAIDKTAEFVQGMLDGQNRDLQPSLFSYQMLEQMKDIAKTMDAMAGAELEVLKMHQEILESVIQNQTLGL